MDITRRNRLKGQGFSVVKDKDKVNTIDVNFDIMSLNLMCFFVLSQNSNIKRSHLINLRNLFNVIDLEIYKADREKMKRINFILKALEAKLEKNLKAPEIIIKYCSDGFMDDGALDINPDDFVLNGEEIAFVNGTVSETLKYSFIYNDVDNMLDVLTRFKASNYLSKGAIVKEIEDMVDRMKANFRRVANQSVQDQLFTLTNLGNLVADAYDKLTNGSNRILTTMHGLNELTYGGFESTRLYMFFGVPGVGKSVLACNLLTQIKKANSKIKTKDPTKRPAVVLVTMENQIVETIERLYDIVLTPDKEIPQYTVEELIKLLKTEGELCITDASPVDIIVKYVPNGTVDTGYFYTLTEELEDEGIETIALIFDYINCIRASYHSSDIRIELGNVTAELKTFAVLKDIPVISFGQMNRDAAAKIDNAKLNNIQDISRVLGRTNIAESIMILNNIDFGAAINVEYDAQGNKYMVFNRFKIRGKSTPRYYICHPFKDADHIGLYEDFYDLAPAFKETLKENIQNNFGGNSRMQVQDNSAPTLNRPAPSMDRLNNSDNVFLLSQYRSSQPIVQESTEPESYGPPLIDVVTFTNIHSTAQ